MPGVKLVPLAAGKGPNDAVRPGFDQLDGPAWRSILFREIQRNFLLEPLRRWGEFNSLCDAQSQAKDYAGLKN